MTTPYSRNSIINPPPLRTPSPRKKLFWYSCCSFCSREKQTATTTTVSAMQRERERDKLQLLRPLNQCRKRETATTTTASSVQRERERNFNYDDRFNSAEREKLQLLGPLQQCRKRETATTRTASAVQKYTNCNYHDRFSSAERKLQLLGETASAAHSPLRPEHRQTSESLRGELSVHPQSPSGGP